MIEKQEEEGQYSKYSWKTFNTDTLHTLLRHSAFLYRMKRINKESNNLFVYEREKMIITMHSQNIIIIRV